MAEGLKVFWVLAWNDYYPEDALNNVDGTYATREEAEKAAQILRDTDERNHVEVRDVSDLLGLKG